MEKIEKHVFSEDPLKEHPLCTICKLPERHPVHKEPMIKGTATPDKLG